MSCMGKKDWSVSLLHTWCSSSRWLTQHPATLGCEHRYRWRSWLSLINCKDTQQFLLGTVLLGHKTAWAKLGAAQWLILDLKAKCKEIDKNKKQSSHLPSHQMFLKSARLCRKPKHFSEWDGKSSAPEDGAVQVLPASPTWSINSVWIWTPVNTLPVFYHHIQSPNYSDCMDQLAAA